MENISIKSLKNKTPLFLNRAIVISISAIAGIAFATLSLFHFLCCIAGFVFPLLLFQPYIFLLLFVSILVLFPNAGYGAKEGVSVFNIYGKGSGLLPFALITISLFFLFMSAYIKVATERLKTVSKLLLLDWSVILFVSFSVIYILIAFLTDPRGISMDGFRHSASQSGVMGFVQFGLVYFVVKLIVSRKEQLIQLNNLILALAVGRAIYGIIRFLFLGGDPRNFYANFQHINIKLTFFDIFDSAFLMYLFSFCFMKGFKYLHRERYFIFALLLSGINIILSFRRTAWIGFVIAILYLSHKIDKKKRIFVYVVLIVTLLIALPILSLRFGSYKSFIADVSFNSSSSREMGRFGELFYAIRSIAKSPLLGLGATGHYDAPTAFQWAAPTEIVHSSVVFIALKMGLVGSVIVSFVIVGICSLSNRIKKLNYKNRDCVVIFYAACAALIFLIPAWLFGTPFIEFRHSAGFGLFVGLSSVSAKLLGQDSLN